MEGRGKMSTEYSVLNEVTRRFTLLTRACTERVKWLQDYITFSVHVMSGVRVNLDPSPSQILTHILQTFVVRR